MIFEYWMALSFVGVNLNAEGTMTALTGARLAFLTPLPGGAGALETSQVIALSRFGYPAAAGISVSLLIRARDVIFGGIGLLFVAYYTRNRFPIPEPNQVGD